jgi:hypothetical protein
MRVRRKRRMACKRRNKFRRYSDLKSWNNVAGALATCTTTLNLLPYEDTFDVKKLNSAVRMLHKEAPLPVDMLFIRGSDFENIKSKIDELETVRGIPGIRIMKIPDSWLEPGNVYRLPASFKYPPTSCGDYRVLPGMLWGNHGFIIGTSVS